MGVFNYKILKMNLTRWLLFFYPKYNSLEFSSGCHAFLSALYWFAFMEYLNLNKNGMLLYRVIG